MKAFFAGLGMAVLAAFAPGERAEASSLGFAQAGIAAGLSGSYDQTTGDVAGVGSLIFAYDFDLPLEQALYSGFFGAVLDASVLNANGDLVATESFLESDVFGPEAFALGAAIATPEPEVAAVLAFLTGLPPSGALDLSLIGLDSVTGSYTLTPNIAPTFGTTATRIFGTGEFEINFDFADAAGGDLATEVALLAPASGFLEISAFGLVEIEASPIPLPAGAAMLPAGLIGFAVLRRRRSKRVN